MAAEPLVGVAAEEEELAVGDLVDRARAAVHALGAAVAREDELEDLRLHEPLPEGAHLLRAGDGEERRVGGAERGDGARVQLGTVPGVGVGEEEELAARRRGAGRARPLLAEPFVGERRRLEYAQPPVPRRGLARDVGGAVGGVVVHDDELEPRIARREHRPHEPPDVPPLVAAGDDHRQRRRVRRRRRRLLVERPRVAQPPGQQGGDDEPREGEEQGEGHHEE